MKPGSDPYTLSVKRELLIAYCLVKEEETPDLLNHAGHALALHDFRVMVKCGVKR
ncbi:MAG: hypothetical protein ACREQ7_11075 [Candidatus Binatia bacterium]